MIMIVIVMMKKPAWIQTKTNRGIRVQDELNQVGRLHVLNQQLEPGGLFTHQHSTPPSIYHPTTHPSYNGPQHTSNLRTDGCKENPFLFATMSMFAI